MTVIPRLCECCRYHFLKDGSQETTETERATSRYLSLCESLNDESNDMKLVIDVTTPFNTPYRVCVGVEAIYSALVDFIEIRIQTTLSDRIYAIECREKGGTLYAINVAFSLSILVWIPHYANWDYPDLKVEEIQGLLPLFASNKVVAFSPNDEFH